MEKSTLFYRKMGFMLLLGIKQVPGVGGMVELAEGLQEIEEKWRAEQDMLNLQQRVEQLEEASKMTPAQVRAIMQEVIAEVRKQGKTISPALEEAVLDIAGALPASVRGRTQATLRHARRYGTLAHTFAVLGAELDQTQFYRSLIPVRRPKFHGGELVPHRNPPWHLQQLLGAGGFGEVWEVKHTQLDDYYAVKFCQEGLSVEALRREAKALAKLRKDLPKHRHIVELIDLQLEQEPYWLAFEYVSGGTLEDLMCAKSMSWKEVQAIFIPLLEGMAAVHRVGIVHRDLKPANILLTEDGIPKIADFGIGKILVEQQVAQPQYSRLAQDSRLVGGSPGYMSPEQEYQYSAHPTDDVYALAVILWQLVTHDLKIFHFFREKLKAVTIPEAAKALILECLERPRELRPQNAGEFLQRFLALEKRAWWQRIFKEKKVMEKGVVSKADATNQPTVEQQPVVKQQPTVAPQVQIMGSQQADTINQPTVAPQVQIMGSQQQQSFSSQQQQSSLIITPIAKILKAGEVFRDKLKDGSLAPEMVVIPAGKFKMGDIRGTGGDNEKPVHEVTIAQPYAMGRYPVTFEEYDQFCQATQRNKPDDSGWGRGRRPVIDVSWQDAVAYCVWLSKQTGKDYCLPTESEWEYAARGGTETDYWWGNEMNGDYCWYDGNSGGKTQEVGKKTCNPFGLYDVLGNVCEWTDSQYESNYSNEKGKKRQRISQDEELGKKCAKNEIHLVIRGGSWFSNTQRLRCANCVRYEPADRNSILGFRLCLARM